MGTRRAYTDAEGMCRCRADAGADLGPLGPPPPYLLSRRGHGQRGGARGGLGCRTRRRLGRSLRVQGAGRVQGAARRGTRRGAARGAVRHAGRCGALGGAARWARRRGSRGGVACGVRGAACGAAGEGAPPHRPLTPPRPPTWAWAWAWACCASSGPWPRPRRRACRSHSGPSSHSAPSCAAAAIVRLRVRPRVAWAWLGHGSPTHCTHCAAHTPVAHAWHARHMRGRCGISLGSRTHRHRRGPEGRHQVDVTAVRVLQPSDGDL